MVVKLCIPQAVPLPSPPVLAKCLQPSNESLGNDAFQDLRAGELVYITGGVPDGTALYAVAAEPSRAAPLREGWVKGSCVQALPPQEAATAVHMPLRELLQRVTLVRARKDWWGTDASCLPTLRAEELLQLGTVRDTWAYAWSLEQPGRSGWFPTSLAERLAPDSSSLMSSEECDELSENAIEELVKLMRQAPRPHPNALSSMCPPELPPVVAASAQHCIQDWEDKFVEIDAREAAAQVTLRAVQEQDATQPQQASEEVDIFPELGNLPDESFPLFVCKTAFASPHKMGGYTDKANKALLPLELGDLVRVVSLLHLEMYCGFREDTPNQRTWFPRRCVEQLEDPLDSKEDAVPLGHLGIGPPPLPQVPPRFLAGSINHHCRFA